MAPDVVARIDRAVADALRAPEVQEKIIRLRPGAQPLERRGTRRDPGGALEALGGAHQGLGLQGRVGRAWGATAARSLGENARMTHTRTPQVLISEVGPRDGLQSVKATMPTARQAALDRRAARRGPARDRGRLLRAGEAAAADGRRGRGGAPCADAAGPHRDGAGAEPARRRRRRSRPACTSSPFRCRPAPRIRWPTCARRASRWSTRCARIVALRNETRAAGARSRPASRPPSAARCRARCRRTT